MHHDIMRENCRSRKQPPPGPCRIGDVVYVCYSDHVLFKDADASEYHPWIRETIGWLDFQGEDFVRIVWERFHEPQSSENARLRSTGLSISRNDIMEMRRVG